MTYLGRLYLKMYIAATSGTMMISMMMMMMIEQCNLFFINALESKLNRNVII